MQGRRNQQHFDPVLNIIWHKSLKSREGITGKFCYVYYKQYYATKACTNKDHVNLRDVVGKARQSLLLGVFELRALC